MTYDIYQKAKNIIQAHTSAFMAGDHLQPGEHGGIASSQIKRELEFDLVYAIICLAAGYDNPLTVFIVSCAAYCMLEVNSIHSEVLRIKHLLQNMYGIHKS